MLFMRHDQGYLQKIIIECDVITLNHIHINAAMAISSNDVVTDMALVISHWPLAISHWLLAICVVTC